MAARPITVAQALRLVQSTPDPNVSPVGALPLVGEFIENGFWIMDKTEKKNWRYM